MKLLSEIPLGGKGRLLSVEMVSGASQRLMALGFLPGLDVQVVAVAPFGDPITVEMQGRRVSLRRAEASAVRVEETA